MKKTVLFIFLLIVFLLSSCFPNSNDTIENLSEEISDSEAFESDSILMSNEMNNSEALEENQGPLPDELIDVEVIEEEKYYKVVQTKDKYGFYYAYMYDTNGDIVEREGPWNRQPRLSMPDEYTVKYTLQAGTGFGTQWGYYYNVQRDALSRVFECIFDERNDKVVYGGNKLVVRDIYDKRKYYREFTGFSQPYSKVAVAIVSAVFIDDTHIEVTYLTGEEYRKVKEILVL